MEIEPERVPCSSFPLSSFGLGDGLTSSKSQTVGRCLASLPRLELPLQGPGLWWVELSFDLPWKGRRLSRWAWETQCDQLGLYPQQVASRVGLWVES